MAGVLDRVSKAAIWRPLREKAFRRLFVGEGFSLLADQAFFVALTLLVVRSAGPGIELGSVLAVAAIPGALLMPLGGALSDRYSPAALMVASSVGRVFLMAFVAALVLSGSVDLWHLYLFGGLLSVLDALYYPASLSVVPTVVGREKLTAANALVQGAEQASQTVGPVLAAFAVATVGLGVTFGANALLFLASVLAFVGLLRSLKRRGRTPDAEGAGGRGAGAASPIGFGGMLEGVRYAWGDPVLRGLIFFLAVLSVASFGPVVVGGAALAEERLGGAGSFGVLLSGFGVGSLAGLLVAGLLTNSRRRGPTLLGVMAVFGLGLGALGFVPNLAWALGVAAVMGVGVGYLSVTIVAWLQERVEAAVLGRVMGLVSFSFIALDPVSFALTGLLMEIGLAATFVVAGSAVLSAVGLATVTGTLKNFD